VPGQSLFLLNSDWAKQRRAALAERIEKVARESGSVPDRKSASREQEIRAAFRLIFGRLPHADEQAAAEAFFLEHPEPNAKRQLQEFVQTLLNSNEFAYLE
jgi:hypothetical protein